jgi:hypothetical protein
MRMVKCIAGAVLLGCAGQSAAEQQVSPLADDVRVDVDVSGTAVEVLTHDERTLVLDAPDLSGVSVDIRGGVVAVRVGAPAPRRLGLTVHPEIQLNISGVDSAIEIRAVRGPVTVQNHTQAITIEDINGSVDATSRTGRIRIRRIHGNVIAESNTNAVDIRDVTGDVRARSTTSSVRLRESRSTVVELQSISGIVSYEGELPRHARYRLGTHSGEVILHVPATSNATILMHGRPQAFAVQGARIALDDDDFGTIHLGDGRARVVAESVLGAIRVSVRE